MRKYLLHRLLQLIPILLGITLLSFGLIYLAGGDAVTSLLENQNMATTQEIIDAKQAQLGLHQSFIEQYLSWLGKCLQGNMGTSYISGEDVLGLFASKLPATILLALFSVVITIIVAIPLGIVSATHQNRFTDYVIRALSFVGNSLPSFFIALIVIFVFSITLGWLPAISINIGKSGFESLSWQGFVLPTVTLACAMIAKYTRQIRAVVLDELKKPYVTGARARGVPERIILFRNVLKCTMIMLITLLALSLGDLLGGTAIIETIFQFDGVGKLAVDAITMRDYPVIQAYVMWMAIIYVLINLIADIAYYYLDPRIRLGDKQ